MGAYRVRGRERGKTLTVTRPGSESKLIRDKRCKCMTRAGSDRVVEYKRKPREGVRTFRIQPELRHPRCAAMASESGSL